MSKKLKTRLITVTPNMAAKFLAKSRWNKKTASQNRNISNGVVVKYIRTIKRGEWNSYPGLHFDSKNRLVDGHHRLHAIIASGKPVQLYVVSGLTDAMVECLDTGRKRSLAERQGMFLSMNYRTERNSWLSVGAEMLVGRRISLFDFHDYNDWEKIFGEGLEWAVTALAGDHGLRSSGVAGAMMFAYHTDPQAVMEFADKVRSGAGLVEGEPALVLLNHMRRNIAGSRSGTYRMLMARRVLNALKAHLEGEKITKLLDTDTGLRYFERFYTSKKDVMRTVKEWGGALRLLQPLKDLKKRNLHLKAA